MISPKLFILVYGLPIGKGGGGRGEEGRGRHGKGGEGQQASCLGI